MTKIEKYKLITEITKAVASGYQKVKHHTKFTKRCVDQIRASLEAVFGTRAICYQSGNYLAVVVRNEVRHEASAEVHYYLGASGDWQTPFEKVLAVDDMTDYIERAKDEEKLVPQLLVLAEQVEALRKEAHKLIAGLPKPISATVRSWEDESASYDLADRFPLLFK